MASMMILEAAASASRSAAAAAAAAGSAGAAASDPRGRMSSLFRRNRSTVAAAPPPIPAPARGKVEFVAEDKDLESDEALWALYERWCKAFNQERSPDEMARRFSTFKETVFSVDSNKKARLPYTLAINMFADGKMLELVSPKVFPNDLD